MLCSTYNVMSFYYIFGIWLDCKVSVNKTYEAHVDEWVLLFCILCFLYEL